MTDVATKLKRKPRKPKADEIYRYNKNYGKNHVHQADLLYLPEDDGYKYCLVVVDGSSRLIDAEPLKTRDSKAVLSAFKKIYDRDTLSMPNNIQFDAGTEFKADVKKHFADHNVRVRVGRVGRHKQQALVENKNKDIGKKLFLRMSQEELVTGDHANEWVSFLKEVVSKINKRTTKNNKNNPPINYSKQKPINATIDYAIGDKVRVKIEEPTDAVTGKRLSKGFRATDYRWHPLIRTVMDIKLDLHKPPLYILSDVNNPKKKDIAVAYSGYELQAVTKDESFGDAKDILLNNKKQTTFIAQEIVNKKKEKGKIYYEVKYRGHKEPVWQARTDFIKNAFQKELIHEYEDDH